jgi:predicted outer membrane repeat protein
MFLFLQSFRAAWVDSFPGTTPTTYSSGYGERQTPSASSDGGVYILNSLFNRFTSTSDGGALYCSTSVTYLLIESTSFFSCNTSAQYGGAIYFDNTNNDQCVLYGVCCNDCCSTNTTCSYSQGQFAYFSVQNIASSKNHVNYSSIARCVNENSNSWYTLRPYNGKICCPSVNISMNKCDGHPGICCQPFSDSNSVTCSLSYSSFADNNATGYICIWLEVENMKLNAATFSGTRRFLVHME